MVKQKMRDSNFELLRIFAMLLIIMHHITVHVIYKQLKSGIYPPGTYFNNIAFYKKLALINYGFSFGKIGNGLFILITGYFLCGKPKINIDKTVKKLLSHVLYATIVLIWASVIIQYFDNTIISLPTMFYFNDAWWFIGYYLIVVVIAHYFLNKYVNKLNQNQYRTILYTLFGLISLSFSRIVLNGLAGNLSTVVTGIFLFLLGGYIRKYDPFKKVKISSLFIVLLLIATFTFVSYRNLNLQSINIAVMNGSTEYYQPFSYCNEYTFVVLLSAIILFEIFKRINIKNNKVINYVSSTTFMIYLLHDNDYVHILMNKITFVIYLHENVYKFMGVSILLIIGIFIIGIILYRVYEKIYNYIEQRISC